MASKELNSIPGPQGEIQKKEVTGKLEFIKKMEITEQAREC